MKVTHDSPEYTAENGRQRFDAHAWALVHFLLFSDKGSRRPKLDQYLKLVADGTNVEVAMREAFGPSNELNTDFANYVSRDLFSYLRFEIDASVKREAFPTRALPPSEAAAALAVFMQR